MTGMSMYSINLIEYYDSNGFNSLYIKMVNGLKIMDLKLNHSRDYIIEATNGYTTKMMNFKLNVIDIEIIIQY